MISNKTLDFLYNKVDNDLDNWLQDYIDFKDKTEIIMDAHKIYHAQNFFYMIEAFTQNYEYDDLYYTINEKTIDKILNYSENIVVFWVNHKDDVWDSDRYNLEYFRDFVYVLEIVVDTFM